MRIPLLALLVSSFTWLNAQWQTNGVAVCDTTANGGIEPLSRITTDGKGGAIMCWRDARNGRDYDIYAQRVSSRGYMMWQHNGVPVVALSTNQDYPRICSDGKGGAFVAWEDDRGTNTFPYAQWIDSLGQPMWQVNGVKVAETPGLFISLTVDEFQNLYLGWSTVGNAYMQKMNGSGNRVWGDSGIQVTNRPGNVSSNDVAIVADGTGGGNCWVGRRWEGLRPASGQCRYDPLAD